MRFVFLQFKKLGHTLEGTLLGLNSFTLLAWLYWIQCFVVNSYMGSAFYRVKSRL